MSVRLQLLINSDRHGHLMVISFAVCVHAVVQQLVKAAGAVDCKGRRISFGNVRVDSRSRRKSFQNFRNQLFGITLAAVFRVRFQCLQKKSILIWLQSKCGAVHAVLRPQPITGIILFIKDFPEIGFKIPFRQFHLSFLAFIRVQVFTILPIALQINFHQRIEIQFPECPGTNQHIRFTSINCQLSTVNCQLIIP